MSRLRLRRGEKILGSTDDAGLSEWIESGLISEFDLVEIGEGTDDWRVIRDYLATRDAGEPPGSDSLLLGPSSPVVDEDPPLVPPTPRPPDRYEEPPPTVELRETNFRPVWEVDVEPQFSDAEPDPPSSPPPKPKPKPQPKPKSTPPTVRKRDEPRERPREPLAEAPSIEPRTPVREISSALAAPLDEAEIDRLFGVLLEHERTAPAVEDPAAKAPAPERKRKRSKKSKERATEGEKPLRRRKRRDS